MDALREFSQSGEVQQVAKQLVDAPGVQGLVMEFDPFLRLAWRQYHALLQRGHSHKVVDEWMKDRGAWWNHWYRRATDLVEGWYDAWWGVTEGTPVQDPSWRPPLWDDYLTSRERREDSPFRLRIVLEPDAREMGPAEPGETVVPLVFFREPVADLLLKPTDDHDPVPGGVSVGARRAHATLGGILQEAQGADRYGLSCAHAFDSGLSVRQAARQDGTPGRDIGVITHRSALTTSVTKPPCNPALGTGAVNEEDFALIRIDGEVSTQRSVLGIGAVAGIGDTDTGESVSVAGKATGLQRLWVGGFTLTRRYRVTTFDASGNPKTEWAVCNGLFELLRADLKDTLKRRPVSRGDSGAWVMRDGDSGPEWAGVVVAGSDRAGYALPSRTAMAWARREGLSLQV